MTGATTTIIGAFFLLTAALKAFYSKLFIIHVKRFKLLPEAPSALAALLYIELEAALGLALILQVYLNFLLPLILGMISVFSLLSLWGYKYRKLDDCGCYGGLIKLPQTVSLLINFILFCGTMLVMAKDNAADTNNSQNLYFVVAVILVFHVISKKTLRKPLVDILKLQPGKPWILEFYPLGKNGSDEQEVLFILLESNCSLCKTWMQKLLDVVRLDLKLRIIVLSASEDHEKFYQSEFSDTGVTFFSIQSKKRRFLRGRLPMAVRIDDGIITSIRSGSFPEDGFFL